MSDVLVPIEDLIEPSVGLGQTLMGEKLIPVLHQVRELLVDLQLKALATSFQHFG